MRGTASDVLGMESETWLRKTVSDRRTVTSEMLSSVISLWLSLSPLRWRFIYLLWSFRLYFQISKLQRQTFSLCCFSQQYQRAAFEGIQIEAVGAILRELIIIETEDNIWIAKCIDGGILIIEVDYSEWSLVSLNQFPYHHNTGSTSCMQSFLTIQRMKYWIY